VNDLLIFGLLFIAIVIGWILGRRGALQTLKSPELPSQYYSGLNYLLDDRPDGEIDAFVDTLEVNSQTLETHLALGNVLRKRGEVDRAIRIHQNLLARPSLPRAKVHLAHLELARDYISAGLLDRAERLLLDLVSESAEQRLVSLRHLLEIYTSEREWQQAIDTALQLLPRRTLLGGAGAPQDTGKGQQVAVALAHFYCEQAASRVSAGELSAARSLLGKALDQDAQCVRASIMLGEVEYRSGQYKQAIKALRRVRQQDVDYLPETVATLRKCYQQLDDEATLKTYLQDCLGESPPPKLLLAVAEDICEAGGKKAASEFLSNRLAQQPSLRGLARLIELEQDVAQDRSGTNLALLQVLVDRLLEDRPQYRCLHCGFSGRQLHWFCPGCQYWGTIKSIGSGGLE
jgi:lipopolysaccharide assembly protein B